MQIIKLENYPDLSVSIGSMPLGDDEFLEKFAPALYEVSMIMRNLETDPDLVGANEMRVAIVTILAHYNRQSSTEVPFSELLFTVVDFINIVSAYSGKEELKKKGIQV